MMILAYIASIVFSCLLGMYDAMLYGRRGAESFPWNEHIVLVLIRSMFPIAILIGMNMSLGDWFFLATCYIFHYSFFLM
jgi:hypothetical protein